MEDTTVAGRLDAIARRLESLAGITPAASVVKDPEIPSKLKRIEDALTPAGGGTGALEAHALGDHTNTDLGVASADDLIYWDGTQYALRTPYSAMAEILALSDLTDVADGLAPTGSTDAEVLKWGGTEWDSSTLGLEDLSDVDPLAVGSGTGGIVLYNSSAPGANWREFGFSMGNLNDAGLYGVVDKDIIQYDASGPVPQWVNVTPTVLAGTLDHGELDASSLLDNDHTQYVNAVAAAPLTLAAQSITFNYDTNDFQLSGNDLQIKDSGVDHGGLGGLTHQADHTWALTIDGSRPLTGAWAAGAYGISNTWTTGSSHDNFEGDATVTIAGGNDLNAVYRPFYADINYVAGASGIALGTLGGFYADISTSTDTGTLIPAKTSAFTGVMGLRDQSADPVTELQAGDVGLNIILKTDYVLRVFGAFTKAINAGVGVAYGYEGYGHNTSAGTNHNATGIYGYAASTAGLMVGVQSAVATLGVRGYAYSGSGHMQNTNGVLNIYTSQALIPHAAKTHIGATGDNGSVYIEKYLEVDNTAFFDNATTAVQIGAGVAGTDYRMLWDGETNDGVITWMEDEDYFQFADDIKLSDGENLILDTTTGTKIGTATTQKLGFYNATPVDQPDTVADADGTLASATTVINLIIDRLQELGLIA